MRALVMDYGGVLTEGPPVTLLPARARRAGVATALLSDAAAVPDEVAAAFDLVALGAGEGGPAKPDPEAFLAVARALGVPIGACVVVDDVDANLRGARQAGAVVVRHTDAATTVLEVEILLDLHPEPEIV